MLDAAIFEYQEIHWEDCHHHVVQDSSQQEHHQEEVDDKPRHEPGPRLLTHRGHKDDFCQEQSGENQEQHIEGACIQQRPLVHSDGADQCAAGQEREEDGGGEEERRPEDGGQQEREPGLQAAEASHH